MGKGVGKARPPLAISVGFAVLPISGFSYCPVGSNEPPAAKTRLEGEGSGCDPHIIGSIQPEIDLRNAREGLHNSRRASKA